MSKAETQILKNQASIMMVFGGLLDFFKIEDLEYMVAIRDRIKETRDVLMEAKK